MNLRQTIAMPLRAPFLDRQLLAGVDPHREAALEKRAQHLCSRRLRDRLASALEQVLAEAEGSSPARSAKAPVARQEVLEARTPLLDLARRLRSDAAVDPQGVLLVRRLLSDPAGPLATSPTAISLEVSLRRANAALAPRRRGRQSPSPWQWPLPGPDVDEYA
jgi:hypothetical protein